MLGQFGGWSVREPGRAVIVGLWSSHAAHQSFLAESHDEIAQDQAKTYESIAVDLLEVRLGHDWSSLDVTAGAPVLRIAACILNPGRMGHVLEVQQSVWIPAMKAAGMQRSLLARGSGSGNDGTETVVVMSWWPTLHDHDRYQRDRVPKLRETAAIETDFSSIDGDLVELVPNWTIAP